MIKFQKHFVTDGTTKVKVHYGVGVHYTTPKSGKPCVTLYAKEYGYELDRIFPLMTENGTDYQTDYFDRSRTRIFEGHKLYPAALERAKQNEKEFQAKLEKKHGREV